jgi:hypothetical protein
MDVVCGVAKEKKLELEMELEMESCVRYIHDELANSRSYSKRATRYLMFIACVWIAYHFQQTEGRGMMNRDN